MSKYQKLIHKLKQNSASIDDLMSIDAVKNYFIDEKSAETILSAFGLPIEYDDQFYSLKTAKTPILNQEYCFVDIETNGSNPAKSQIIEIAAIKTIGLEIVDSFDSMVYCDDISEMITEITGISADTLRDKPSERVVLDEFKIFLSDSVFVAHNVDFDFGFITQSMQKYDLPPLLNRKFCTIDLAKKTIEAQKYGLKHLAELLNLEGFLHHRAYSDAMASFEIFKKSLANLPKDVVCVEDLIDFSTAKPIKIEGEEI